MITDPTTTLTRRRQRLMKLFGALTAVILGLGGSVLITQPAQAAEYGYGQWLGGYWHGSYYEPGSGFIYCLDIDREDPGGVTTTFQGQQSYIPAAGGVTNLSGNLLAGINWLISTHGQSTDNATARAVHDAIWTVTAGYSSSSSLANQFAAQVQAYTAPTSGGTGSMTMTFTVDPVNNYAGTLNITALSPSPATGVITLTNGVFTDTNSATRAGTFSAGQVLPVRGVPPTADGAPYKIGASADLQASGPAGYAAQVGVWARGNYQRLAGGGGPGTSMVTIRASVLDPTTRSTDFQPIASTQVVSAALAPGDTFKDTLTFGLAADETGTVNEWRRAANGDYLPIIANGTVYGPFIDRPVQSPTVPAGAPVAGHFTATTTLEDGPTIQYPVESDQPVVEAGYYVAVVVIDWADQSPSNPPVQLFIPEGYHFQDDFGQLVETSIVPFTIEFSTQLSVNQATIGDQVTDRLTPRLLGGAWLRDGGTRVPVEVTGTWYFSSTEPEQSATPPVGAEVIATQTATLSGPGILLETTPVQLPYREGWVTVQWCGTASIYVNGYCDDYGVPAETVALAGPTVVTTAQATAVPTDTVVDVATVDGPVPAAGLNLTFAGFLQTAGAASPTCTPETLVYSSSSPTLVTDPGEYSSEPFDVLPEHIGLVYWVETLTSLGGEIVHVGECGLPNETTTIAWPTVETAAIVGGGVGGEIHDVAIVGGLIPTAGLALTFAGHLQPADTEEPSCTPETLVYSSAQPTMITDPGEYQSEGFEVLAEHVGTIYWVETVTLVDDGGNTIWEHVGECGLPNETTRTVEVTTKATDDILVGEAAFDTAVVSGSIPDPETTGLRAELTFAAFRATEGEPTCATDEQVFTTEAAPIVIESPGTYESAETAFVAAGHYYWVETVTFIDEVAERPVEVHVGECGLPAETTRVESQPLALTGSAGVVVVVWVGAGLLGLGLVVVLVRRRRQIVSSEDEIG
jgi:LPXTG-motif cell wall-anchored protein